jgi:hypothetical protein
VPQLEHPDKSAKTKYNNTAHCIQLQNIPVLSTKSRYMTWIIRKANEIELDPNNMNREDGLHLNWSCKPFIHSFKGCRKPLIQHYLSYPGH